MFDNLSGKFSLVFERLRKKGRITEADVDDTMREIRLALLEADVNFKIAREFISQVRAKALELDLLKGISPGQQIIKLVNDEIITLLGTGNHELLTSKSKPNVIMLIGLQGSGKTTTAAKIAALLKKKNESPLLVAADLRRAAAIDQLQALGSQLEIPVYAENSETLDPLNVCKNGIELARKSGHQWVILDTGGRLQTDKQLMKELKTLKTSLEPSDSLLVVDAMTGQDAVNTASEFNEQIGLTGLVLSKLDGDTRGGAALTANHVTGVPIKFVGTGEKIHELEIFHAERMASRILGMGDIVSLVERAQQEIDQEAAAEIEKKIRKSQFDLNDFLGQLEQVQKMGSISSILDMLPGASKVKSQLPSADLSEQKLRRTKAMISSMTMWERQHPDRINGSRRRRIAQGSGMTPADLNQLLNQFKHMQKMMKQFATGSKRGLSGFGINGF
tara:strand:+ start:3727 stop:5067 length:1341 start_codon:yes stop_codon:yes gene_type:complete